MSKWIPSREEKYAEMRRKHNVLDTKNIVEAEQMRQKKNDFLTVSAFMLTAKVTNLFFVQTEKPLELRRFAEVLEKVEEELEEVAREIEEEEKRGTRN